MVSRFQQWENTVFVIFYLENKGEKQTIWVQYTRRTFLDLQASSPKYQFLSYDKTAKSERFDLNIYTLMSNKFIQKIHKQIN